MKHTKILSRCFLIFMMSLFFGHVFPSDISSEMTDPVASESEEGLKRLSGETDSEFTSRVAQDAAVNVSRAMDEKLAAIVARDGLGEAATENKMQAAHALVSATEENVGRLQNISDKSFNLVADNATEYASKSPVEQASEKLTAINKGETAAGATRDATDEVAKKLKKFAKKLAKVLTKKGQGAESQAVKKEAEVALNEFTAATRKLGDADCEAMAEQAAATGRKMINQIDESFAKDANSLLSVVKDATGKELDQTMADKICDDAASTIKMDADRATNKIFSKLDNQAENALKDLNTVDKYKAKWGSKSLASDSARFGRYMKKPFVGVADSVGSVTARGVGKGVSGALWHVGSTLFQAVLFMVPSIFQSSMLAQKQRQVELETLAQPLKFGDWVLQIPDSCINMNTPTSSFPIYVRIPVDFVGEDIDITVAKQFGNSISGPTNDNPVSSAIHTFGEDVFSFGAAHAQKVKRYKISNESKFYDQSGLVVAFAPAGSYAAPASTTLMSSQFAGLVVDLNTGYVMDAAGGQNAIWPLINLTVAGTDPHNNPFTGTPVSVKDFLPLELSKLGLSGNKVTYTQYKNVTSGSTGNTVSAALQAQFDCACVEAISEFSGKCSSGRCLLSASLDAYTSGLFLNAEGTAAMISSSAALVAGSVIPDGLGSVIPMFGWGKESLINLKMFPNSTPVDPAQYSLITALPKSTSGFWSSGSAPGAAATAGAPTVAIQAPVVEYADPTLNYGAQGCWVYLCANTAFAHALQTQESGGKKVVEQSTSGPLVDYIIFLDENSNQVPLQAPTLQSVAAGSDVKWPTIGLNPTIKYWASLISSGIASFNQDGGPVMYDLQGNAYGNPALAGIVSAAIAELSSYKNAQTGSSVLTFPNLAAQFNMHSQAMLSKYYYGPFTFGNVKLTESTQSVSMPATGSAAAQTINFYEGMNCFASSVPDLVLAMDSSGNTATLPNPNVTTFYSVVTDIMYTKLADGSLKPTDFSQAPVKKSARTYLLRKSAKKTFNIVDMLSNSAGAANTTALASYAKAQRDAWFNNFENAAQAQGFNLGALAFKLASGLSVKSATAHDCFIYEVTPSPSAAITNQDLYVLANAGQATLETLTPINVLSASSKSTVVSLLTGLLYDTQGNQLLDATGTPIQLSSAAMISRNGIMGQAIYDYMLKKFPIGKGMTSAFESHYLSWVTAYAEQMHRPMGPYTFGSLNVGIYAGDLAAENYVYFSAAGMHRKDFEPADMFITVDFTQSPPAFGKQLDNNTKSLLSLVSGQLYGPHGPVSVLPQVKLVALTAQLKTKWGHWLQTNVARLQEASVDRLHAQTVEQAELDAAYAEQSTSNVLLAPAEVLAMIKRLRPSGLQGLPSPYESLKFDPLKQMYVRVSPASSTDLSALLYQFFDVKNSYEADGNPVQLGAIFDQTGRQVRVVKGVEQQASLDQYGVIINDDGTQSLGVPLMKPSLAMTDVDKALVPGQSGDSMIVSSDPNFPGKSMTLSKGYYLYFSKKMSTYYAFETKRKQWISIEGGNLYEKDGTPVIIQNKVAKVSGEKGENDMILLYKNQAGYMQGYIDGIDYKNVDSSSDSMNWLGMSSPYKSLTVIGNKREMVYRINKKAYAVDSAYVWEPMVLVPIDNAGNIRTSLPDSSYGQAQLVLNNGTISYLLFHGKMYKKGTDLSTGTASVGSAPAGLASVGSASAGSASVGSASAGSALITMVPVVEHATMPIQISMGVDYKTKAPFMTVSDGTNNYKYGYFFDQLDSDQQVAYQASIWKGCVVACPIAFPVGPMQKKSTTVGGNVVSVSVPDQSTYALFVKNIPDVHSLKPVTNVNNAPAGNTPAGQIFGLNLFRVLGSDDGRFFVKMYPDDDTNPEHAPVVSYFNSNGYVDVQTGALFNESGMPVGYALNLNDWLAVLDKVQVSVMPDDKGVNQLVYRNSQAVQKQMNQLVADTQAVVAR